MWSAQVAQMHADAGCQLVDVAHLDARLASLRVFQAENNEAVKAELVTRLSQLETLVESQNQYLGRLEAAISRALLARGAETDAASLCSSRRLWLPEVPGMSDQFQGKTVEATSEQDATSDVSTDSSDEFSEHGSEDHLAGHMENSDGESEQSCSDHALYHDWYTLEVKNTFITISELQQGHSALSLRPLLSRSMTSPPGLSHELAPGNMDAESDHTCVASEVPDCSYGPGSDPECESEPHQCIHLVQSLGHQDAMMATMVPPACVQSCEEPTKVLIVTSSSEALDFWRAQSFADAADAIMLPESTLPAQPRCEVSGESKHDWALEEQYLLRQLRSFECKELTTEERQRQRLVAHAVLRIQSAFRARKNRRLANVLRYAERWRPAMQTEKPTDQLSVDVRDVSRQTDDDVMQYAATMRLQAFFRGKLCRKALQRRHERSTCTSSPAESFDVWCQQARANDVISAPAESSEIPCDSQTRQDELQVEENLLLKQLRALTGDMTPQEMHKRGVMKAATVRIQAYFRGCRGRRAATVLKHEERWRLTVQASPHELAIKKATRQMQAATRIQSVFRGQWCRKFMEQACKKKPSLSCVLSPSEGLDSWRAQQRKAAQKVDLISCRHELTLQAGQWYSEDQQLRLQEQELLNQLRSLNGRMDAQELRQRLARKHAATRIQASYRGWKGRTVWKALLADRQRFLAVQPRQLAEKSELVDIDSAACHIPAGAAKTGQAACAGGSTPQVDHVATPAVVMSPMESLDIWRAQALKHAAEESITVPHIHIERDSQTGADTDAYYKKAEKLLLSQLRALDGEMSLEEASRRRVMKRSVLRIQACIRGWKSRQLAKELRQEERLRIALQTQSSAVMSTSRYAIDDCATRTTLGSDEHKVKATRKTLIQRVKSLAANYNVFMTRARHGKKVDHDPLLSPIEAELADSIQDENAKPQLVDCHEDRCEGGSPGSQWSASELVKLRHLVATQGVGDWKAKAAELGTQRTPQSVKSAWKRICKTSQEDTQ